MTSPPGSDSDAFDSIEWSGGVEGNGVHKTGE